MCMCMAWVCLLVQHTKDRRYESKDSLEMPKGSMSPRSLLVSVELRDR